MRKFYLVNDDDERISLNNETGIYLNEPKGLGVSFNDTYSMPLSGFYMSTKTKESQGEISGTLYFLPREYGGSIDPYSAYRDFIRFLEKSDIYDFEYDVGDGKIFKTDCKLKSLDKSELDKYGALECDIVLIRTTPWYIRGGDKRMVAIKHNNKAFKYGQKLEGSCYDNSTNTGYYIDILNEGTRPASFYIKHKGKASNINIRLQGLETGDIYGNCTIGIDMNSDETFEFCTTYGGCYVRKILSDDHVDDLIDLLDVSSSPFFRIPNTEPCRLFVDADGMASSPIIEVTEYYRSV